MTRVDSKTHALDRRSFDEAGRMHVPDCRISKANVCGYLGREIPDWQSLRLNPNQVYQLYRDPAELERAAATFDRTPLTLNHIICTADEFPAHRVCGAVSNVRFEAPYLVADLSVWTGDAIALIASDAMRELSCAYLYDPVMIPGTTPDGVRFDGRMTNLRANHVAVVEKGRAGPDVMVADTATGARLMKRPKFIAALAAVLGTLAKPEQLAAIDSAMDEDMLLSGNTLTLTSDEEREACDAACKAMGKDTLSPEEKEKTLAEALEKKRGKGGAMDKAAVEPAPEPAAVQPAAVAPAMDTAAMDAAISAAVAKARDGYVLAADAKTQAADAAAAASAAVHAFYAARDAVAAKVGVIAADGDLKTASAVYRFAMDKAGIPHAGVPDEALAPLWAAAAKAAAPAPALDAAPAHQVADLFPGLTSIRKG